MKCQARADAESTLPIDSPRRRRLPALLRQAWYRLNQAFRRRLAPLGLTPDQFTVLRTLLERAPEAVTQRRLADLISSDPNTIASLLKRMEGAGLIARKAHTQDARAQCVRVLPAGRRKFEAARAIAAALQMEVLTVLPEQDREQFLEYLARVAEACHDAASERVC